MALIGNRSVLLKSPGRYFGGSTVSDNRSNFGTPGSTRGRFAGAFSALSATPRGYRPPYSWIIAIKNGDMASVNLANAAFDAAGLAVGGITTTASASFAITTNTPAGELIAFGVGSASWSITTNTPLLTASLNAIGSSSFAITTNTPLLGAIASGNGSAGVLFSVSATILPANDASPLRTASASFAITGSLTPYAIGSMSGSTVDGGVLTVDAIAAGVLAAALAAPIRADIRKVNGYTINGSGTTPDPWGP